MQTIRVVFRFLFTVPLAILAIDGVRPHAHINQNSFATGATCYFAHSMHTDGYNSDFLVMIAGIGCAVSSAITLVVGTCSQKSFDHAMTKQIFFPRSIEGEIATRDAAKERKQSCKANSTGFISIESQSQMPSFSPIKRDFTTDSERGRFHLESRDWAEDEPNSPDVLPPLQPNRKTENDIELGVQRLTVNNVSKHTIIVGNVNPMISNYTSPIGQYFFYRNSLHFL